VVDKHLAKAVVDIVVFLEFSEEGVLDADAAVGTMEQLAAELQLMSDETKSSQTHRFHELAREYGDRAKFVESLGETLGLVD
jgi:hypothetical protein